MNNLPKFGTELENMLGIERTQKRVKTAFQGRGEGKLIEHQYCSNNHLDSQSLPPETGARELKDGQRC